MLIKANMKDISNTNILHPLIRKNTKNTIILDYRLRCRSFKNRVPIKFLKDVIMVSEKGFIQNNYRLSNKIRNFVTKSIDTNCSILGIGGESYMYLKNIYNYNNKHFITNNEIIYNDARANNLLKNYQIDLVDYNSLMILNLFDNVIINLSKLNVNVMKHLNTVRLKKIIIISCNHTDFWNKLKILTNFSLLKREKFIDDKLGYFITVNVLVKKVDLF